MEVAGRPTSRDNRRRGSSLTEYLQALVADDRSAGLRLPSEQELGKQFGVSRNLVREVIESFAAAGMVRREWGVGTFVTGTARAVATSLAELRPLSALVASQGHECTVVLGAFRLCDAAEVPFPPSVEPWADAFWRLPRTYRVDGSPAFLIVDYVPGRLDEREFDPELVREDVMPVLEEVYGIDLAYATASLMAALPDDEVRRGLECPNDMPLLKLEQTLYDRADRPVGFAVGYHRTDRFAHTVVRYRTRSLTP